MSKLFSYYSDKVDHAWYDSSNVVYSECIDNEDALKTLKIVFSNGTQYQYEGISVNDYLLFREAQSQGQTLNKLIKQRNEGYSKLENVDLEKLNEEYALRSGGGFIIENTVENGFIIKNVTDEVVYSSDGKIFDKDLLETITGILASVGTKFTISKEESYTV